MYVERYVIIRKKASALCMLTMFGFSACIFFLWHTLFVVQVVESAVSATLNFLHLVFLSIASLRKLDEKAN